MSACTILFPGAGQSIEKARRDAAFSRVLIVVSPLWRTLETAVTIGKGMVRDATVVVQ